MTQRQAAFVAGFLMALIFSACTAQAQEGGELGQPKCDGFCGPRIVHHGYRVGLATTTAFALRSSVGLPPLWASGIAAVGIGLVPHLVNRPPLTLDWAADLWYASAPLLITVSRRETRHSWPGVLVFLAGYALLSPHSRP